MTMFFSLLNIGAINSQIVYRSNTQIALSRRNYLTKLAKMIAQPQLERRSSIQNLSLPLKQKFRRVANLPPPPPPAPRRLDRKPRCSYCPAQKNRFTQSQGNHCSSPVCKEHVTKTVITCTQCYEYEPMDQE